MGRGSTWSPNRSVSAGAAGHVGVYGDGCRGGGDGVAQQGGVEPGRGWLVGVAGCVEADDGVVVDDAACLVFGDFDVADAGQLRGAACG